MKAEEFAEFREVIRRARIQDNEIAAEQAIEAMRHDVVKALTAERDKTPLDAQKKAYQRAIAIVKGYQWPRES